MGTERQPRKGETIVINADGEKRIVPKAFLKNRKVMNQFGWREDTGPKISAPSARPQAKATIETVDQEPNPFQDISGDAVTDEGNVQIPQKPKAGRPSKK